MVATATKNLQDQLAGKDLPVPPGPPRPTRSRWAVLKGRSNYLCMQRLSELGGQGRRGRAARPRRRGRAGAEGGARAAGAAGRPRRPTGDRAELDDGAVRRGVGGRERQRPRVPGRVAVPERRELLRGGGPAAGGGGRRDRGEPPPLRPRPRRRRGDPARARPRGDRRGPPARGHRVGHLRRRAHRAAGSRTWPGAPAAWWPTTASPAGIDDAGRILVEALRPHRDHRLKGDLPHDLGGAITVARGRVEQVLAAARAVPSSAPDDARARALRLQQSAGALIEDLGVVEQVTLQPGGVGRGQRQLTRCCGWPPSTWPGCCTTRCGPGAPRCSPAPRCRPGSPAGSASPRAGSPSSMWAARSTTRTRPSCTAPPTCPTRAPAATSPRWPTSWPASSRRPAAARSRCSRASACSTRWPPRSPTASTCRSSRSGPLPKGRLHRGVRRRPRHLPVRHDGVLAGHRRARASRCSLVVIDRIPFPRPDEPLLQARRERAGADAFARIDLPAGHHAPRPGRRPADPHGDRPGRGRRARPPPGQRPATGGTSCGPSRRCGAPRTPRWPATPSAPSATPYGPVGRPSRMARRHHPPALPHGRAASGPSSWSPGGGRRCCSAGVTVVFIATVVAGAEDDSFLGYVQAIAEASMVGGLADWFAVVAIFRHPLGLPIPHTAIIPERKAQFGETLGDFIQSSFLTPDAVAERVAGRRRRRPGRPLAGRPDQRRAPRRPHRRRRRAGGRPAARRGRAGRLRRRRAQPPRVRAAGADGGHGPSAVLTRDGRHDELVDAALGGAGPLPRRAPRGAARALRAVLPVVAPRRGGGPDLPAPARRRPQRPRRDGARPRPRPAPPPRRAPGRAGPRPPDLARAAGQGRPAGPRPADPARAAHVDQPACGPRPSRPCATRPPTRSPSSARAWPGRSPAAASASSTSRPSPTWSRTAPSRRSATSSTTSAGRSPTS